MIDSRRTGQTAPLKRRDSLTVMIEGPEDLTVIDHPPGFPTDDELQLYVGTVGTTHMLEIQETKDTADRE